MTEAGIVKRVAGKKVEIEIDSTSECGHCPASAACQLDGTLQKRTLEVRVDFPVKVGDLVEVEVSEGQAIASAFLVFILPLLFLGAGYAFAAGKGQAMGALGAFAGFLVGLGFVWFFDRYLRAKNKFNPHIARVIKEIDADHCQ